MHGVLNAISYIEEQAAAEMLYTVLRPSSHAADGLLRLWRRSGEGGGGIARVVVRGGAGGGHHEDAVRVGQCWSAVVQPIAAPVGVVWSVVRCFDRPQA
jgi:hypothetical protein